MSMIERVARAIYGEDALDGLGGDVRQKMMDMAKAAIEAMRDPTDEMECAALDLGPDRYPLAYWQTMIDAALAED